MLKRRISRIFGKIITGIFGERFAYGCKALIDRKALKRALKEDKNPKQLQEVSKVAIIFIGTNKYINFFPKYYYTIKEKFLPNTLKDFFVFTDIVDYDFLKDKEDVVIIPTEHKKWPFTTLLRFKTINTIKNKLRKYSHIIYIDADMYVNRVVLENEFFCHNKPLFGVQHDAYVGKQGEFEIGTKSLAAVKEGDDLLNYWVGSFWGGKRDELLKLLNELERRVDDDLGRNVIAKWHDESQINKYLIENKAKVHTLPPSYSYPQLKPIPEPFKKKIIHIIQIKNLHKARD